MSYTQFTPDRHVRVQYDVHNVPKYGTQQQQHMTPEQGHDWQQQQLASTSVRHNSSGKKSPASQNHFQQTCHNQRHNFASQDQVSSSTVPRLHAVPTSQPRLPASQLDPASAQGRTDMPAYTGPLGVTAPMASLHVHHPVVLQQSPAGASSIVQLQHAQHAQSSSPQADPFPQHHPKSTTSSPNSVLPPQPAHISSLQPQVAPPSKLSVLLQQMFDAVGDESELAAMTQQVMRTVNATVASARAKVFKRKSEEETVKAQVKKQLEQQIKAHIEQHMLQQAREQMQNQSSNQSNGLVHMGFMQPIDAQGRLSFKQHGNNVETVVALQNGNVGEMQLLQPDSFGGMQSMLQEDNTHYVVQGNAATLPMNALHLSHGKLQMPPGNSNVSAQQLQQVAFQQSMSLIKNVRSSSVSSTLPPNSNSFTGQVKSHHSHVSQVQPLVHSSNIPQRDSLQLSSNANQSSPNIAVNGNHKLEAPEYLQVIWKQGAPVNGTLVLTQ